MSEPKWIENTQRIGFFAIKEFFDEAQYFIKKRLVRAPDKMNFRGMMEALLFECIDTAKTETGCDESQHWECHAEMFIGLKIWIVIPQQRIKWEEETWLSDLATPLIQNVESILKASNKKDYQQMLLNQEICLTFTINKPPNTPFNMNPIFDQPLIKEIEYIEQKVVISQEFKQQMRKNYQKKFKNLNVVNCPVRYLCK